MKLVTSLCFLLSLTNTFAIDIVSQENAQNFLEWRLKYNRTETDPNKYNATLRETIFYQNQIIVEKWRNSTQTVVLEINKFADLTVDEFVRKYTGLKADQVRRNLRHRDYTQAHKVRTAVPIRKIVVTSKPTVYHSTSSSWDWRKNGCPTIVKDQGSCGCCWAFATVAAVECSYAILKKKKPLSFSEQFLVDCDIADGGCLGGWPPTTNYFIGLHGVPNSTVYPYSIPSNGVRNTCNSARVQKNFPVNKGLTTYVQSSLRGFIRALSISPVVVAIDARSSIFQFYSSGIITSGCDLNTTNHAITCFAFNSTENSITCKNSWGTGWGEQGFVRISGMQHPLVNYGYGQCGIFSFPMLLQ